MRPLEAVGVFKRKTGSRDINRKFRKFQVAAVLKIFNVYDLYEVIKQSNQYTEMKTLS